MMAKEQFMGCLVNNTGLENRHDFCDIRGVFEDAIRNANGRSLPEEITDIFTVKVYIIPTSKRCPMDRGYNYRLLVYMMDD